MSQTTEETKLDGPSLTLNSSMREIKDFLNHPTWRDIQEWVKLRLDDQKDAILYSSDLPVINRLQGEIGALQDVIDLPEFLIQAIETERTLNKGTENGKA